MTDITVTTNKTMQVVADQALQIWPWQVPAYLFMGGITAGIMIFAAYHLLKSNEKHFHLSVNQIIVVAPIAMSIGMLFLFLKLTHKLYVWQFYTSFQLSSPMSWGAWILILVYPATILMLLATVRKGFPSQYEWVLNTMKSSFLKKLADPLNRLVVFSEKNKRAIAYIVLPVGILLGIYTGVLLNNLVARPFWNSALLGPLFLVSGASTGAAFILLLAKSQKEKEFYVKADVGLITVELLLIALFIISMLGSHAVAKDAVMLILTGTLTPVFWSFVVVMGLSVPLILEILELRGRHIPGFIAPSLVLLGGLILRFVIVEAGQISNWLTY